MNSAKPKFLNCVALDEALEKQLAPLKLSRGYQTFLRNVKIVLAYISTNEPFLRNENKVLVRWPADVWLVELNQFNF